MMQDQCTWGFVMELSWVWSLRALDSNPLLPFPADVWPWAGPGTMVHHSKRGFCKRVSQCCCQEGISGGRGQLPAGGGVSKQTKPWPLIHHMRRILRVPPPASPCDLHLLVVPAACCSMVAW